MLSRDGAFCLALLIAGRGILGEASLLAADNRSVSASKISLLSGPGSIEGLGESFEPQLNTGTYAMGLPLKLPPVRGAVQPEVRFTYNSGSGNGPLGLGWRLDVPALQRQTDKGLPHYTTNDTFVTFGGEELVALADGTFRAENEASFTRWKTSARAVGVRPGATKPSSASVPPPRPFRIIPRSARSSGCSNRLRT